MRLISRITTGVSIVLLLACCGVWLLLSAPRAGFGALTIPTSSMRPTMPVGSLVLVRQVPDASLRVGDIVTYVDPFNAHKTITHRIVKTFMIGGKVPAIMTRGDANSTPDVPVPDGSVQGRVIWHVPYAGLVLSWARSWAGIAVLVYLPALLVMIEEIKRLRDYYRLSLPYRLAGYRKEASRPMRVPKLAAVPLAAVALIADLVAWQPLAGALFTSNAAAITANHIAAAAASPASDCHSSTDVSINSSMSQTALTGPVSNDGPASGPEATSGSANNTSTTNVNISVLRGC